MKRLLFLISAIALSFNAFGQTYDTLYFASYQYGFGHSEKEGATFYQLSPQGAEDRFGKVQCYYLTGEVFGYFYYMDNKPDGPFELFYKNGKLRFQGTYSKTHVEGEEEEWYANGKMKAHRLYIAPPKGTFDPPKMQMIDGWDSLGNQTVTNGDGYFEEKNAYNDFLVKGSYQDGWRFGQWESIRDDGSLYYQESYEPGGKLISGTSYNTEGEKFEYTEIEAAASFPGEVRGWGKYLKKNLKYPKQARRQEVEGPVYLTFTVAKDGTVEDAKVVKGIGPLCDAEALRVISNSPNWNPGMQRGQKVKSRMSIMITFRLK